MPERIPICFKFSDVEINNGTSAEWQDGDNVVKVVVTAENDTATKTYTVTVTKA